MADVAQQIRDLEAQQANVSKLMEETRNECTVQACLRELVYIDQQIKELENARTARDI